MRKKEILFVTSNTGQFDEGLSYAIYLAGTLGQDLNVLILGNHSDSFSVLPDNMAGDSGPANIQLMIKAKCDEAGIRSRVHTRLSSRHNAVNDFLDKNSLDMLLLSPSLSRDSKLVKDLLKISSRPVVTLAKEGDVVPAAAVK